MEGLERLVVIEVPDGRSSDDEPNGGFAGWIWSSRRKSSPENFSGNEEV